MRKLQLQYILIVIYSLENQIFYISLIVCVCILTSICTHSSFHFDCDHIPKLHYHFISAMFGAKSP